MTIQIWTDGACSGNPGCGGWAFVLRHGQEEQCLRGAEAYTTNNRMELMAAIKALEACTQESVPQESMIELYTDSNYLKQGITLWVQQWQKNGWRTANKKPVKNDDLWRRLVALAQHHQIRWRWVKAHAGIEGNEKADQLARLAIEEFGNSKIKNKP